MIPSSLITTPFTASCTTTDVLQGVDLTGVRAVVTGASSGLGVETTRALTEAGAEVIMAVRNESAGNTVASRIASSTGRPAPRVRPLDLADPESVN